MRFFVKGKEITNPVARMLVGVLVLAVFVLLLLLFLPLIGITLALSLSVVAIVFAAVVVVALFSLLLGSRHKVHYPPSERKKDL
jgi:archaellum biogenesis protein FlaJ (TadC family)